MRCDNITKRQKEDEKQLVQRAPICSQSSKLVALESGFHDYSAPKTVAAADREEIILYFYHLYSYMISKGFSFSLGETKTEPKT